MDCKVDYLSFTLKLNLKGHEANDVTADKIYQHCMVRGFTALSFVLATGNFTIGQGRKNYKASFYSKEASCLILFGGGMNHTLIEISGMGCQFLRDHDLLLDMTGQQRERVTRLDVACDLADKVTPDEFATYKGNDRMKITQRLNSHTGDTVVIGSEKSERFVRVYCYREPHPRAGVTRVEHVYRSQYAKSAVALWLDEGFNALVTASGNTYKWGHEAWNPEEATDSKIKSQRMDREQASTLLWLIEAVAPALAKAHKSGLIELSEFIGTHVLPLTGDDNPPF